MIGPLFLSVLFNPVSLSISNVEAGETVRYPLLLIRGATSGTEVLAGLSVKSAIKFPAVDGRYQAAVELKPGANMVLVAAGRETVKRRWCTGR